MVCIFVFLSLAYIVVLLNNFDVGTTEAKGCIHVASTKQMSYCETDQYFFANTSFEYVYLTVSTHRHHTIFLALDYSSITSIMLTYVITTHLICIARK